MKKFLMCCAMMAAVNGGAMAQYQLANNDFEGSWKACYPWEAGKFVTSAKGKTPPNWCVSNVSQDESIMPIVAEQCSGFESSGGVKIINVSASIGDNTCPGYITLGTTWATAETKLTSVRNADGGVFGGIPFTHHPDAIQLRYQRSIANGAERCSLVGYLWKGEWKQADVPSNTAVGVFSWGTATKVTMINRDRNILNMETITGGTVTPSADAELIASLESYQSTSKSSWTTWIAEFDYKTNSTPEMLNIVVSATDYFADRSGIVSGNYIMIDDVTLLYYSELATCTYNGNNVTFTNGAATVNEFYDASKLSITSNGHGATVETNMDAATQKLTITIKGENISEEPTNYHTYTIQFKDYFATLEATYDDTAIIFDKNNSATVNAFYEADKLGLKPSDAATTALSMDEQTQLLTITVTSGDGKKVVPYTIQFNQYEAEIVSATYNGTPVTFTNNAATVNERYVKSNLTLVLSDGANSTLSPISTTQLLTITVTSKNNAKTNTYTIQFPTSFTYTIKGGKGHWGTFCFPGKVTSAEGIEVYSILGKDKETDPSWISLTQVTKFPLTDGMPYIYLSTKSDETIQVITDASYATNPRTSNGLVGVYKDTKMETTFPSVSVPYILTGNKIQKAGSGVWCRANHAWIKMSGSGNNVVPVYTGSTTGNVKYFYIANDLPTDIESIENEAQQPKQVFDLSGRRVTNPTKGGIYIVNGKKIVIR